MFIKKNIKQKVLLYASGLVLLNIVLVKCNIREAHEANSGVHYNIYFGDIHNHNSAGYAKGSLQRSFDIARSHLDFYELTTHSFWHDIPMMEGKRQTGRWHGRVPSGWKKLSTCNNDPGKT